MSFGDYPSANVKLVLDEIHVTAPCLSNPSQGWITYPVYGPKSNVTFINKTILDSSNQVAANYITSGSNTYAITGTPNIGDTLVNSAPGTLSWSSSPPSTTAPIIYIYGLAASGGNGSVNAPFQTISAAIASVASVTTQKIFVIWPGTYAEAVTYYTNSVFIGFGQPQITSVTFSNAHGEGGLSLFDGIRTGTLTMTPGTNAIVPTAILRNLVISTAVNITCFDTAVGTLTIESSDMVAMSAINCSVVCKNSSFSGSVSLMHTGSQPAITTVVTNSVFSGTFAITGTANYSCTLQGCTITSTTISGVPTLKRDFISSGSVNSTNEVAVGGNSFLSRNLTSIGVGSGTDITSYTNSTFLGIGSGATSSAITGSIAIGRSAVADTNNQCAFTSTITQFKAAGLSGHAASTQMTFNTVNGQINYLSSTRAKKENIEDLDEQDCLRIVDQLQPRSFNWIEDGTSDIGFIAEEAADVSDFLVAKNKDDEIVSVNYFRIVTNLVGAVKELKAIVDEQGEMIRSQQMLISNLSKK